MSSTIVVQGHLVPGVIGSPSLWQADALVKVNPASARSVSVEVAARGAIPAQIDLGAWDDNALVEVQFDQGLRVWMSVEALRKSPRFNLGTDIADIHVAATVRGLPSQRGIGDWVIKALTVFDKPAASVAHAELVKKIEDGLNTPPGLYTIGNDPETGLTPFDAAHVTPGPYLVFLHGTASSTKGSFGGLWQSSGGAAIAQLTSRYTAGHILALQHRSLSVSPIDNALVVAQALPAGAVLHLVSHSRGGLIGELLARADVGAGVAPFSDDELTLFDTAIAGNAAWLGEGQKLRDLNTVLAQKRFRIERFVRVACPALGTTLASGKLQDWCNIVMNVLGAAGTLAAGPTGAAIADLLKGLIGGLITFDDLPGLQAMDPGGALIKLLNAPDVQTNADLAIVGGITEGDGIWNRLKMLLVDAFFTGDNDLVVDTPSMSGGTARERGAARYIHDAADINHFEYFTNPVTARHLLDALGDADRLGEGFENVQVIHALRGVGVTARGAKPALVNPPIVFVLPGIMGTDLDVNGDLVWVSYRELFFNGLDQLRVGNPGVTPAALDDDTYTGLIHFLGQTHEVIPFPYDWRLALDDAGKKLNDALRAKLALINPQQQPIRLVAHSMGGLVARAMMLRADSVWPELCKNAGARLLMLGTPNRGSHAITSLLLGQEHVLKLLCTVNIKQGMRGLLGIIKNYRGALDMMPWPSDRDYFDPAVWANLLPIIDVDKEGWPAPDAADLAASHDFCAALATQHFDNARVFYVAGHADETPIKIQIDGTAPNQRLKFIGTSAGDGRVPWDGGIPGGMSAWYVDAVHGDIPAHAKSYSGFLDILQTGTTNALSKQPPALARGADAVFEMRELPVSYLPDADAVRRAGIGGASSQRLPESPPHAKIAVRVSWGDLRYASHIVMVGHYAGDTIVSAEAALDASLGGELRRRHQLGVYPDRIGTALVVEDAKARPPGAIVVGLGEVGDLSSGRLSSAIAQGILNWMAERFRDSGAAMQPAGLSLLLVGSGAAGLSITGALSALLRSVSSTLDRLGHLAPGINPISEIEFIELFEDRAHSLWHELGALIEATELKDDFVRSGTLTRLPNARRRMRIDAAPEWWQRLVITREDDRLLFNDLVARARSEVSVLPTQWQLVDRLLLEATQKTMRDEELESTLFELLIPNDLKDAAPRRDNLLLVLDKNTARFPWELMTDPQDVNKLPQAVSIGALRQFKALTFRREPAMVTNLSALTIGDPLGPFAELPGAQKEARCVADLLAGNGYTVKALNDRPPTSQILRALYATPYRILHLAGHGVADISALAASSDDKNSNDKNASGVAHEAVSGMVLEAGVYLTYAEIEQMRHVPQFVFVNCCHLGAIIDRPNEMAAQFAQQFIEIGVRAVIAAGWAVDDDGAGFFALEFYTQMLQGVTFGEAVRRARRACFEKNPTSNTWGAYQCYGDPDFRLALDRDGVWSNENKTEYASENDLVIEGIERVLDGYAPGTNETAMAQRIDQLAEIATDLGFLGSGRVDEALAASYARVGCYDSAISHYRAAIAADDGRPCAATFGAIAHLTDLRARLAVSTLGEAVWGFDAAPVIAPEAALAAAQEVDAAIKAFTVVLDFGRSRERLVTLAAAWKHLALVVNGAKRSKALTQLRALYVDATKAFAATSDPSLFVQIALAEILLHRIKSAAAPRASSPAKASIEQWLALAAERSPAAPAGITAQTHPDLVLVRAIHEESLDDALAHQIAAGYQQLLSRSSSYASRASIRENLGFVHAFLLAARKPPQATLNNLKLIYRALA